MILGCLSVSSMHATRQGTEGGATKRSNNTYDDKKVRNWLTCARPPQYVLTYFSLSASSPIFGSDRHTSRQGAGQKLSHRLSESFIHSLQSDSHLSKATAINDGISSANQTQMPREIHQRDCFLHTGLDGSSKGKGFSREHRYNLLVAAMSVSNSCRHTLRMTSSDKQRQDSFESAFNFINPNALCAAEHGIGKPEQYGIIRIKIPRCRTRAGSIMPIKKVDRKFSSHIFPSDRFAAAQAAHVLGCMQPFAMQRRRERCCAHIREARGETDDSRD